MPNDSRCLRYLPAFLRQQDNNLLPEFLKIFDALIADIEQKVDRVPQLFDPWQTPVNFLPWLASWVALGLPPNWDERAQRALLARIVQIYRKRGLGEGLRLFLRTYVGPHLEVTEDFTKPHFFRVRTKLKVKGKFDKRDYQAMIRLREAIRAILDQEKPAHTYYEIRILCPTIRIGVSSTVGKDTILGSLPDELRSFRPK